MFRCKISFTNIRFVSLEFVFGYQLVDNICTFGIFETTLEVQVCDAWALNSGKAQEYIFATRLVFKQDS